MEEISRERKNLAFNEVLLPLQSLLEIDAYFTMTAPYKGEKLGFSLKSVLINPDP